MLAAMKKVDGGDGKKGAKPGGGLLGLGGLGGLTGVGNLKSKMTGIIGNKIDEAAWRSNLTDMHRVRNMARTLWLSLEHTNEAVMRVALEIVTCRKARKILWWNDDSWSMEDGKPEHLRTVIDEKFDAILQMLGREIKERPPAADPKAGPSNREIELEKSVADLEKKLKIAELSLTESKRLMEEQEEELRNRMAQTEKSGASRGEAAELERLRALEQEQAAAIASMRAELQLKISQLEAVLGERTAELERARKEAEEAKEVARQKTEELDRLRRDGAGAAGAQLQREVDELRQRNDKLQAEVALLKTQLAAAQAQAATSADRPVPVVVQADSAELERLRKLEAEWNSRGETCCTCGKPCAHCTGAVADELVAKEEKEPKKSARNDKEVQELQQLIESKNANIAKLKAEKKELETERLDMLAMIDKLRRQINMLTTAAREAGHGDLVDELMEKSEVAETMRSPEMSCFSRLYQDAVRRMTEGGRVGRRTTQKDAVRDRVVATKQSVFQMDKHFPAVTPPSPPPPAATAASTRRMSLGCNVRMNGGRQGDGPSAALHAHSLPNLESGAAGAGRGGGSDRARAAGVERHAHFEPAGIAEAATYSAGGSLPGSRGGAGPTSGGLPRHGGGNPGNARLIATTGSFQKDGSPQARTGEAEFLWDFGPGRGSEGPAASPRSPPRALPTKPLGPGFAGPASLRRGPAAQGLPRTDAANRLLVPSGAGLQVSRSEPQLQRAASPNRLPQLPAGKGGQPPSRSASRPRQGSKGAIPFG